ncbi:hypothetical protein CR513_40280, partial [Mucuna pruriens]
MCLMITKLSILEAFRGSISESQSASRFLKEIEEYIMEVSNLATKLKSLKFELNEDLVFISLPAHFGQFKVSYNTQKDKWSINELISHCA